MIFASNSEIVTCNTQKDKGVRRNHITSGMSRTAIHQIIPMLGILAASWPCGIMLFVSELFGSESISQVYLSLHQYFDEYKDVLDELSKLL